MDAQDRKMFKAMPLDQVALALPHFESQSDMETIIKLREKDFGKNPDQLIALLENSASSSKLKSAIANTNLAQTEHLNFGVAGKLLAEMKENDELRVLMNFTKFKFLSAQNSESPLYGINPKTREKAPIDQLVTYMTRVPEVASHFLQQPHRRKQLSQTPALIAQMFAENNGNLRKTLEDTKILALVSPQVRYTLRSIEATALLINDTMLKDTKEREELKQKLKDIMFDSAVTEDGKNAVTPKKELSHDAVVNLYNEVKANINALESMHTTQKMLQDENLKKNPDALKSLEQQLKEIKKIDNIDQKQTALTNLQGNIQTAIKTELETQAKKEVAQTQSNSATTPKKQWPTENKENASPQRVRKIKLKPLKEIRAAEEKMKTSVKPVTPRSGFRP